MTKNKKNRSQGQDRRLKWWNNVFYETMAPLYNCLDWLTCGAWWNLQKRALDYVKGPRVLEVGFGPGRLFEELATRPDLDSLDGIDLAEGMCRFTKYRIEKAGLNQGIIRGLPTVNITRGSVYDMPYPDGTFDTVVTTFAFSGFDDGGQAMVEMARVLAPRGKLVVVDIGLPLDSNRVGTFLARLWEWCGDFLYDIPHIMERRKLKVSKGGGLKVTAFEEYGPGRHIRVVVGEKPAAGVKAFG